MSNIASSTYPTVTVSKEGDLFAIVRNGQLMKLNRAALQAYIEQLAPNTLISLSDTPVSYVGQQGKGLVVNATEDAMEFAPTVSSNFLALTDTPANYGGQAGKLAVVNSGETALEFIDNFFIQLGDTPATYTGQSEKIVRVNTGATAVEFVTPTEAAPTANVTGGFFDYDHGGGTQSFTAGTGPLKLLNDAAGPNTLATYAPPGITSVWLTGTNQFDFSELSLGDEVQFRVSYTVTTTAINQSSETFITLAVGDAAEYTLNLGYEEYKAAGTYPVRRDLKIYMGNTQTLNNPGEIKFESDDNATIQVDGWYVSIRRRGA